jgi:chemotaxis protein CheC
MDVQGLGELQLDALREVANVGAGHAATALSELTGRRITLAVPRVRVVRLEEVGGMLGDPGEPVAAVIVRVEGGVSARTLQILPSQTARRLTAMLLTRTEEPRFPEDFGTLERSALTEIGNILVAAYLNALGQFVNLPLHMSVPAMALDMAAAVLTTSYLNFGTVEDHVFCVSTELGVDASGDLPAHFLLIPDEDSLAAILRSLGVA